MKKINIRTLRKVAAEYGATIEIGEYYQYDQSVQVEAVAPDGKQWVDGPQVLIEPYFSYDPLSRQQAYQSLVNRMELGTMNLDDI